MRQQIETIILLVGLFYGVATAGTPTPDTAPAMAGHHAQSTSSQAIDSLAMKEDVSKFIKAMDRPKTGLEDYLRFLELRDRLSNRFSAREIAAECYRQAVEGKHELVLAKLLRYEDSEEEFSREVAFAGLTSSNANLKYEAAKWCYRHRGYLGYGCWSKQAEKWEQIWRGVIKDTWDEAQARPQTQPASAPVLSAAEIKALGADYLYEVYRRNRKGRYDGAGAIRYHRLGTVPIWGDVVREALQQAMEHKQDKWIADLIRIVHEKEAIVKKAAMGGLYSETLELQRAAVTWCRRHLTPMDKKTLAKIRALVRKWGAEAADVGDCEYVMSALLGCATTEDIPLIRKMLVFYDQRFRDVFPKYGCRTVTPRGPTIRYADFVWLLCRLGDSEALREVAIALTQTEDPEKRAWAILLAARLWPNGFYLKAIADALSDKTAVPVPVVVGPPPGVSTQVARMVSLQRFTRVCDVAVRALFEMEPPGKAAPFEVPTAKSWRLDSLSVRKLDEIADDGYHRSMRGAITMKHLVGFLPERIQWTLDYALKCQDERIKKSRSGIAPQIKVFGIDDRLMKGLVEEYARAGQAIHLLHTDSTSDVAAIGAFVGDHHADMLLLGDKPSPRAMEIHGEKWNSLGVDKNGKPDGTGPKEHMIAGRAAAIIVNPANKIESLTLGQVQAIFQGDVDDWAIIGGTGLRPDGTMPQQAGKAEIPINIFGLYAREPATAIFEKECLPRRKWRRVKYKKDTAEALAAVSMDPRAIAFVDLAAIPATGQSVKIVPIKFGQGEKARNIAPTAENIKNAMYPLSQRYFLYVHPKASDTAKVFDAFTTSVLSIEAFRRAGMIPLTDAAIERAMKDALAEEAAKARAEEATKGRGKRR